MDRSRQMQHEAAGFEWNRFARIELLASAGVPSALDHRHEPILGMVVGSAEHAGREFDPLHVDAARLRWITLQDSNLDTDAEGILPLDLLWRKAHETFLVFLCGRGETNGRDASHDASRENQLPPELHGYPPIEPWPILAERGYPGQNRRRECS